MKRYPDEQKYVINLFHLYLQMGLLSKADGLVSTMSDDVRPAASALLALAKDDFTSAIELYTTLISSDSSQKLTYNNNLSLTHLYSGNVQSAIAVLEPTLREQSQGVGALPNAVYNLCTMYEIRDDKARSRKEGVMETVVGRHGDVCGKSHFKLDSLR